MMMQIVYRIYDRTGKRWKGITNYNWMEKETRGRIWTSKKLCENMLNSWQGMKCVGSFINRTEWMCTPEIIEYEMIRRK